MNYENGWVPTRGGVEPTRASRPAPLAGAAAHGGEAVAAGGCGVAGPARGARRLPGRILVGCRSHPEGGGGTAWADTPRHSESDPLGGGG